MVYADAGRPDLVDGFIRKTFTAMGEDVGTRRSQPALTTPEGFDRGLADLERTSEPDGVFDYPLFPRDRTLFAALPS